MASRFKSALLLTGDSNDDLALAACQLLAAHGIRVTVAGLPTSGALLRLSRDCRTCVTVAKTRAEMEEAGPAVLDRLCGAARGAEADIVFAGDIPAMLCADRLKARLPGVAFFPMSGAGTTRLLDNKWSFYGFLQEQGLPTPRTWLVESLEQARGIPLPMIVKPVSLGGGRGVCVVRDAEELAPLLAGGNPHLRLPVIAQELIDGEDLGFSFLAVNGELNAWAMQMRRADRTLDYIDDERVVELGRRLARASNYTGLANVDMRYADAARSEVKILECNPRIWMSSPNTAGLGADFVGRGLAIAAGLAPLPIERGPTGECAELPGIARKLIGGRVLTACEKAFLRMNLRDPLPVAYRRLRTALGLRTEA